MSVVTETAAVIPITPAVSAVALLPVAAVGSAVVGALAVALAGTRTRLRNALSIATCLAVFGCLAVLYAPVYRGAEYGGRHLTGVLAQFGALGPAGISFRVDPTGLLIALVTSAIWLLAVIFGTSYMQGEHARVRFDSFMLLTLAGNIGVLLAGDFFTLFVFFEVMALASYVLVVHGQNPQSLRAGRLYLFMSVIGGLVLLGGVMALSAFTGSTAIAPAGEKLAELPGWLALAIPFSLIVGFAAKAGMFFLHVWLPEAHPVAPSPASALLSGLMVKVGVYGILRTATVLLIPGEEAGGELMSVIGLAIMAGAVATMVAGMVNASFCSNCKELLAYSTISQVGFILLGVGCAAYLGAEGALAIAGVLMYVVSHASFKAALFLTIGAVIWRAREQRFDRLGGMAYRMPFTAVAALVATAAIVGVPGTAGFIGKSLVHHAVLEVVAESGHGVVPSSVFLIVETLFVAVAAGTFAYSTRMFILVFLGKVPAHLEKVKPESTAMKIAYAPLVLFLLVVGLLPARFIEAFIGPALAYYGLDPASHSYHSIFDAATGVSSLPILYDPTRFAPFTTPAVTENLLAVAGSVFFAGTFYLVGHKIGVFDMPIPFWASLALWYRKASAAVLAVVSKTATAVDAWWDRVVWTAGVDIWLPSKLPAERKPPVFVDAIARFLGHLAGTIAVGDRMLDHVLAGAFVDAWVSEYVGVSRPAPTPHTPPLEVRKVRTWAPQADHYIDAALTTVMVDAWIPDAPAVAAAGVTTSGLPAAQNAAPAPQPAVTAPAPKLQARTKQPRGGTADTPSAFSMTRESRDWLGLAWKIVLFVLGAVVIWTAYAIATGLVVLQ